MVGHLECEQVLATTLQSLHAVSRDLALQVRVDFGMHNPDKTHPELTKFLLPLLQLLLAERGLNGNVLGKVKGNCLPPDLAELICCSSS